MRIQIRFQFYNKDKYCRHDRHLFTSKVNQVQAYSETLKNQWLLSEERAKLKFITQKAIPISSEKLCLRQWLQSERQTSPKMLAITNIQLQNLPLQ